MKRISAIIGWRGGVALGALLLAALAGPAQAANTNLTATAKYSSSSDWESDQGNTTFVAAKAFDGDLTTRWNVASGDNDGSWLAAEWDAPVSINKVVVRQAFNRLAGFRVQQRAQGSTEWTDAFVAEDENYAKVTSGDPANPTHTVRLAQPIQAAGLRILFTQTTNPPSIFEVEAYNNPSGTLTGTVTDSSSAPIEGAVVRAGGDSATTDAAGKYTLTTDVGTYNVTAGKVGVFRDRIARAVELTANGTATQDFVLLPLPPNLSRTATAVSSSDWEDGPDYNAAKANDGSMATRWNSRAGDADGSYLEMQWAQAQTFNKVTIREAIGRIRNYTLQRYDEANDAYVDIVSADTPPGTGDRTYSQLFAQPVTSKRLRVLVNTTDEVPSIYELEVANAPVANAKVVVKDAASGNPVPNATITSDLGVVLGTTNAQGELTLLVEPDDYVLSATAEGYFGGAPVAFTINAGENRDVTLTAPATGPNIARTATAAASSGADAALANDGDLDTLWSADEATNQWIAINFDKPTHFTVVQLRGFQGAIQRSFLEMKDESGNWVEIPNTSIAPEFLAIAGKPADFFFPQGITTTGVRYFITATNSATSTPGLAEFLVYDAALPKP
jgi:hypothetical protein